MGIKQRREDIAEMYVRIQVAEGKGFVSLWRLAPLLGANRMQTGAALHAVQKRGIPGIRMELYAKGTWSVRMSDDKSVRTL